MLRITPWFMFWATEWMAMPFISSEQKGVYMYDRAGPQGLGRGLLGEMMNSWNLKSLKCFVGMCINGLKLHEVDLGWRHWLLNALIKHPQPSLPSSLLTEPQFCSGSDVPSSGDKQKLVNSTTITPFLFITDWLKLQIRPISKANEVYWGTSRKDFPPW